MKVRRRRLFLAAGYVASFGVISGLAGLANSWANTSVSPTGRGLLLTALICVAVGLALYAATVASSLRDLLAFARSARTAHPRVTAPDLSPEVAAMRAELAQLTRVQRTTGATLEALASDLASTRTDISTHLLQLVDWMIETRLQPTTDQALAPESMCLDNAETDEAGLVDATDSDLTAELERDLQPGSGSSAEAGRAGQLIDAFSLDRTRIAALSGADRRSVPGINGVHQDGSK